MQRLITVIAAVLVSVSLMGQGDGGAPGDKTLRVGADASADFFIPYKGPVPVSAGLGVRVRYGRPDQLFNAVGGVRYIYGSRLSGFQVPLLVNLNLVRTGTLSAYIGGGYEFDFIGTYYGAAKAQAGLLLGHHMDFRVFYKPYQADLGLGFTYYF